MARSKLRVPVANLPGEQWRTVAGFPGYFVSNRGRVKSFLDCGGNVTNQDKLLKTQKMRNHAPRLTLSHYGYKKTISVAELVLTAFDVPRMEGFTPGYVDGDTTNCKLENLYWTKKRGVKLTPADVRAIRNHYLTSDEPYDTVAARYGVGRETIRMIVKRLAWKHIV